MFKVPVYSRTNKDYCKALVKVKPVCGPPAWRRAGAAVARLAFPMRLIALRSVEDAGA
jgi:hypothetical protein